VRSTHERFVKASGLGWVCLMLLVPVPWVGRVWALPFLNILAPSERYAQERGKQHKKITYSGHVRLSLHTTVNENGEVTSVIDEFEEECT
jgi:hypothetical protein